jgi:hypothetical protein
MVMKSTTFLRTWSIVFVFLAVLVTTSCGGGIESPTEPTPVTPPVTQPTPPPAPAPNPTGRVEVAINPNPVPFSGQPITDAPSCANSPNTWFYEQVLTETGGADVTITGRIDKFDGRVVNTRDDLSIAIGARGSTTLRSRWCSSQPVAHTAQTTFSGRDASGNTLTVDGPTVQLQSR